VEQAAAALIGSTLVTAQTGDAGKRVGKVYVEAASSIARELYLSLIVDRERGAIAITASPDGGMDIEQVAHDTPERILSIPADVDDGPAVADVARLAAFLGFTGEQHDAFARLAAGLHRAFVGLDASLVEINPLIVTGSGELVALDAKLALDDNALFRHPEAGALRDPDEEDPREAEAGRFGLNYIQLSGSIGCMVNGAGLAMATMDMIQLKGERPANFLDVGGGVTEAAVIEGFSLLFGNHELRAILVNIFGGIVRCDIIASGLIEASRQHPMRVPVILRLVGTREAEGRKLIEEAGLDVRWARDLDQAAEFAAAAAREVAA
ncbi:MAG TPA: ADP-forming succinate--CoA ligase subunit beta, partial [Mariprofundaceae bacterium]|nr:ADP-forming succinate--CoA ligase subunit beta [Mariprofundaceae bacterium]